MSVKKTISHGGHSGHGEKPTERSRFRFAAPAVFAVFAVV